MGEHSGFRIALSILLASLVVALVMTASLTIRAHAEPMCAEYKELQAMLLKQGQQQPIGAGIVGGGKAAMALFTSPDGDTWTMVVVGTAGKSCVVGAGQHWSDIGAAKGEPT